jgi:hypothetical protein
MQPSLSILVRDTSARDGDSGCEARMPQEPSLVPGRGSNSERPQRRVSLLPPVAFLPCSPCTVRADCAYSHPSVCSSVPLVPPALLAPTLPYRWFVLWHLWWHFVFVRVSPLFRLPSRVWGVGAQESILQLFPSPCKHCIRDNAPCKTGLDK